MTGKDFRGNHAWRVQKKQDRCSKVSVETQELPSQKHIGFLHFVPPPRLDGGSPAPGINVWDASAWSSGCQHDHLRGSFLLVQISTAVDSTYISSHSVANSVVAQNLDFSHGTDMCELTDTKRWMQIFTCATATEGEQPVP